MNKAKKQLAKAKKQIPEVYRGAKKEMEELILDTLERALKKGIEVAIDEFAYFIDADHCQFTSEKEKEND